MAVTRRSTTRGRESFRWQRSTTRGEEDKAYAVEPRIREAIENGEAEIDRRSDRRGWQIEKRK
ncbi:hypothetical protein RYX36_029030 [Vicia faba]